jgi:hypothetical protein
MGIESVGDESGGVLGKMEQKSGVPAECRSASMMESP